MAATRAPGRLTLSEDDRRILAPWAAACAERVLHLFEAAAPDDLRPRQAIEGLRAFGRGDLKVGPARALAVAAHAAARSVRDPAAVAAARAAGHAVATAHMGAHARGAAAYAAVAARLAAGDADAAIAEIAWQVEYASPEVRAVLRKVPPKDRSGGELGRMLDELHRRVALIDVRLVYD